MTSSSRKNENNVIELKPIPESPADWDVLEKRLKKFFRDELYIPLLLELNLPEKTITLNASTNQVVDALFTGRLVYSNGTFAGELNASISKELRDMGAKFDKKSGTFKLPYPDVPAQIKAVIASSRGAFITAMGKLDAKLSGVIPIELAKQFKCADLFDKNLWKADKEFKKNVKNIAVSPTLSREARAKISVAWQDNMQIWIKDWTEDQIRDLRKKIYADVMGGARRESLVPPILKITKTIQGSHEEALNKAKFLARQETRLLMAAFKQTRYEEAGSKSYIWRCVHRPHDMDPQQHIPGNVRYSHGLLDGKEYKWADPPVTTNPGQPVRRNHPGTDYNCRCFPRPLLRKT